MSSNNDECVSRFERAEQARKEGNWREAASRYADAIRCVEQNRDANPGSVPAEPYRECAKMLYHVGEDDVALEILDRYAAFEQEADGSSGEDVGELRERLATDQMQRQPWRYGEE